MSWTNLAARKSNLAMVSLEWNESSGATRVILNMRNQDEDFVIYPDSAHCLDCYTHPFAYVDELRDRVWIR